MFCTLCHDSAFNVELCMTWEGVLISYNSQMEELEKRLKELRGFVAPWGMKHCLDNPPPPCPRDPWDWTTYQRIHMEGPMALAAYVAEDGLIGHQWEDCPLGLRGFDTPV